MPPRPKKKQAMEGTVFIRVSTELLKILDQRVEKERKARPGARLSRSDVVREILYRVLAEE